MVISIRFTCVLSIGIFHSNYSAPTVSKRWRWLHRLVYISAIGGVAHFCWLVKKNLTNPVTFAILLILLLIIRIIFWLQKPTAEKNRG